MRTRLVRIHGLSHKFYFWGSPKLPKLFLLHGWLDTGASFDFVAPYLERDFHCIAYDMRGYAGSEHAKSELGYFFYEYVADALAIFQKLSPNEPVRMLGHSLGGAVLSLAAGIYPERFSHFINVEGFGFRDEPLSQAPDRAKKWLEGLGEKRFPVHASLQKMAERLRQSNPNLPPERAQFLARHLSKKTKGGWKMAADPKHKLAEPYSFPSEAFYSFWNRIRARCLLIAAQNTEMAKRFSMVDFKAEMKKRLDHFPADSRFAEIKDAGHMVHHERPEELARVVLEFLKR